MISTRRHLSAPESPSKAGESGEILNKIWGWHAFMHVATPSLIANAREYADLRRNRREHAADRFAAPQRRQGPLDQNLPKSQ
jgi:hypothetical protein